MQMLACACVHAHSVALNISGLTFLIFAFVLTGTLAVVAKQRHKEDA